MMMVDGIWWEKKCERWNLEMELELGVETVGEGRCNIIPIVKQSPPESEASLPTLGLSGLVACLRLARIYYLRRSHQIL